VGDHHGAAEAEQDGPAVAFRVQPGGELPQRPALQEGPDPGGPCPGHRGPQLCRGEPDRPLERLQRDVAGEAVGHDHVDLAGQQVAALHVASETQWQGSPRRVRGKQFVRPPGELVALARLGADGEQPDPRQGHAERELGVGDPELAELDQHLRLGVRGRAGVDEHRAARTGRQHHGQPWPQHAGQRPEPEPGDRDDAAGRPGGDHRGRVALPDQLARHGHARSRAAQAGQRALVHAQVFLGRHHAQLIGVGIGAEGGQRLPQPRGGAGQQHPDAVLALRRERAGHDLVGGVITAHGVDRDHRRGRDRQRGRDRRPGRDHLPGCDRRPGRAASWAGNGGPLAVRRPPVLAVRCGAQRVTGGRARG
jgi:hypothetical protein